MSRIYIPVRCVVCEKETLSRKRYCERCKKFFNQRKENAKRRSALEAAYDRSHDGFRCHWCHLRLEEKDIHDPFHLCFDHLIPVKASELVVSSELFNVMKTELAPSEFHIAIEELAAHFDGKAFDRDCIPFAYWRVKAPPPPSPDTGLLRRGRVVGQAKGCDICGDARIGRSKYCARCRRFALERGRVRGPRIRALKQAWSAGAGGFLCQYTGVRVDEDDRTSPWYLSFDHAVPGDEKSLVVSAFWVNESKNALSADEFRKVVRELDACWREKREFDRNIVPFDHWRRKRRRMAVRR